MPSDFEILARSIMRKNGVEIQSVPTPPPPPLKRNVEAKSVAAKEQLPKFGKIKKVDNWGKLSFLVGKKHKLEDCIRKAGSKCPTIHVRWRNGYITAHRILYREVVSEVSEQGHMPQSVLSHEPYIVVSVHGSLATIRLTDIAGLMVLLPS